MVPTTTHRVHDTGEEADGGVLVEFGLEVKARGDAEAVERGAENGDVGIGCADDDADFAERTSGGGLIENTARNLFGFTLDVRSFDDRQSGKCAGEDGALRGETHFFEARAERGG